MIRFMRTSAVLAVLIGVTAAAPASAKWPPWLSIEAPVNPFDAATAGAAFLVHAAVRDHTPGLSDLSGSAEGLVAGVRRTIPLSFDATSRPGVFTVRRQWPSEGAWVVRVSLATTTAIVLLDRDGDVAGVRIPTMMAEGRAIPRAVVARDIDSTLALASAH
jgi:hypothetical protein